MTIRELRNFIDDYLDSPEDYGKGDIIPALVRVKRLFIEHPQIEDEEDA